MNPKTVLENRHTDNLDNNCHASVKSDTAIMVGLGPETQQSLKEKTELNALIDEGLSFRKTGGVLINPNSIGIQNNVYSIDSTTTDIFGPINSKPRSTWTWINRIDFSLSGLSRVITLPTLGKKDLM